MKSKVNGVLKIEKGIPIPVRSAWGRLVETFKLMKPGDSIEAEDIPYNSAHQAASRFFGRGKYKVSALETPSATSRRNRIWRLE